MRVGHTLFVAVVAGALAPTVHSAQPYQPAYDQFGGYGTETLDERVARLEKRLSSETMMEMLNRMDQLQTEVLKIRGEMEELSHALETVKKQQKAMFMDLDQRLQSGAGAATPAEPPVAQGQEEPAAASDAASMEQPVVPAPASTRSAPAPAGDEKGRQAAYQKAFNILKDGKYPEAAKEFKNFLASYPSGEYADNATYWLGETYYVNRDFAAAREAFRKVTKDFPQSNKVSDSLLKMGFIEYDTGQWAKARELLNDVLKRFPDTSAAKLAEKRLAKMRQEGH